MTGCRVRPRGASSPRLAALPQAGDQGFACGWPRPLVGVFQKGASLGRRA